MVSNKEIEAALNAYCKSRGLFVGVLEWAWAKRFVIRRSGACDVYVWQEMGKFRCSDKDVGMIWLRWLLGSLIGYRWLLMLRNNTLVEFHRKEARTYRTEDGCADGCHGRRNANRHRFTEVLEYVVTDDLVRARCGSRSVTGQ
jgi:hypothetical protein